MNEALNANSQVTIFLVEDDDIDAMAIKRSLRKNCIGNDIVRAYDGLDAFDKLKNEEIASPYIILLDIQMPRINGIEFLQKLRADEALCQSIVFVLTTSKREQDIMASYHENIAGYFVKNEVGENFIDMISLLKNYWKIVHLPN